MLCWRLLIVYQTRRTYRENTRAANL